VCVRGKGGFFWGGHLCRVGVVGCGFGEAGWRREGRGRGEGEFIFDNFGRDGGGDGGECFSLSWEGRFRKLEIWVLG